MGVVGRLAKWAAGLGLALLAVTAAAVSWCAERNAELHRPAQALTDPVDAIIVLGGGVDPDRVLGYSSRRRVQAGVSLLMEEKARYLILAGGPLRSSAPRPMAELMRDHAIRLGASRGALLVEHRSATTFENLRFSFELAEAHGFERLAVLTDAYHLERARRLAAYLGEPGIVPVAVPRLEVEGLLSRILETTREAMAWWYNLGKVAAWEGLGLAGVDAETRGQWVR